MLWMAAGNEFISDPRLGGYFCATKRKANSVLEDVLGDSGCDVLCQLARMLHDDNCRGLRQGVVYGQTLCLLGAGFHTERYSLLGEET